MGQSKTERESLLFGTTSCRVLETVADKTGKVQEAEGNTRDFYLPRLCI